MPITPQQPFPKSRGDTVRSTDWNQAVNEVVRLDNAKVNRGGDTVTGALTVNGGIVIPDGSLSGAKLANNSTPGAKLQDGTLPASKVADNSLPGAKLQDGTVPASKIPDNSLPGAKLQDGTVPASKIPDNALPGAKIADSSLPGGKLQDNSVVAAKIVERFSFARAWGCINGNGTLAWGWNVDSVAKNGVGVYNVAIGGLARPPIGGGAHVGATVGSGEVSASGSASNPTFKTANSAGAAADMLFYFISF